MMKGRKRLLPTLMAAPVGGAIATLLTMSSPAPVEVAQTNVLHTSPPTCEYRVRRVQGFRYVRPLLSVGPVCQSAEFSGIEHQIDSTVNVFRSRGELTSASVYLKDLTTGAWMS